MPLVFILNDVKCEKCVSNFLLFSFLGLKVLDFRLKRANLFCLFTWPILDIHIIGNLFYDDFLVIYDFCGDERDRG